MIQNLLERFLRGPTYHTIYSCQHHSPHILWQTELLLMNIITITLGNLGAKQNKILEIMKLRKRSTLPANARIISLEEIAMIASAHGGDFPKCEHGSSVT